MRRVVVAGALATVAVAAHLAARPRLLTWGATEQEAAAVLPGDELQPVPDMVTTRAIWIDAPVGDVWPWVVQIGPAPRAGAYSFDWVENLLGLDMHSADRVIEEFQHPHLGDTIGFGANRMVVSLLDDERVIAWKSLDGNWVWSFVFSEQDGQTRLISRNLFRLPRLIDRVGVEPMISASLVMESKMLRGVRDRAEALARHRTSVLAP